ncbi:hypothetical protein ACU4GD_18080 [Cupriavidus basilensis]
MVIDLVEQGSTQRLVSPHMRMPSGADRDAAKCWPASAPPA